MQPRLEKIPERLQLLSAFLQRYEHYWNEEEFRRAASEDERVELQKRQREDASWLRRNVKAVESIIKDVNCIKFIVYGGTPIDPLRCFLNPSEQVYHAIIRIVAEMLEEAIGVYEHLQAGTGMISVGVSDLGLVGALERALRVAFKAAPADEAEVQQATAAVLTALAVPFTREQEVVEVGTRTFRPDFVVHGSVPLELKLVNTHGDVRKSQEEIAADIAAYKTKWSDLMFLVYDCGFIAEPHRYKETLMDQFGVTVIVVKH